MTFDLGSVTTNLRIGNITVPTLDDYKFPERHHGYGFCTELLSADTKGVKIEKHL
ncbi:hypothetical protein WN944_016089 [Citrus x changshan-huyou]|uniref:Uncharacterized protein n=1 Tax=Citrus x changshan-huyou TaxID=2935761 RepID=A0AAP0MDQ6_9ROSI